MLPEELNDVTTSYHRCMHGVGFTNTFYRRFLAKSPMIAEKFRHTDFDHQKLMLRESLLVMIMFNSNSSAGMDELEQLAERHSRRGVDIPPHLYELWLDALCESVATTRLGTYSCTRAPMETNHAGRHRFHRCEILANTARSSNTPGTTQT